MASVVANLGLTLEVISVARRSLKDGEGTIVAVTNSVRSNLVNNRSTLVPNRNVSLIANRTVVKTILLISKMVLPLPLPHKMVPLLTPTLGRRVLLLL